MQNLWKGITQTEKTQNLAWALAITTIIGMIFLLSGPTAGLIGIGILVAVMVVIKAGWKEFKPGIEVGVLKEADRFVMVDSKTVCLTGMTLLAPFPPFFIAAVPVNIELKQLKFPMTIMSVEERNGSGKVIRSLEIEATLTVDAVPDRAHMDRYILAGEMEKIEKAMGKLPYQVVQHIVTTHNLTGMDMVLAGEKISKPLEDHIMGGLAVPGSPDKNGQLKGDFFGFTPLLVRIDCKLPETIINGMSAAARAEYDNAAEMLRTQGELARRKLIEAHISTPEGERAWEKSIERDLVEKGGIVRVQTQDLNAPRGSGGVQQGGRRGFGGGGGTPVVVIEHLHAPGPGKP